MRLLSRRPYFSDACGISSNSRVVWDRSARLHLTAAPPANAQGPHINFDKILIITIAARCKETPRKIRQAEEMEFTTFDGIIS